jgi:TrmH family RNA methyltransferase
VDSLGDQNPLVKQIRRAVSHGTLTQDGYAVAEGVHLLEEALRARCEIRAVILSEAAKPGLLSEIARDFSRLPEPRQVSEKTFRSLSSTETPQGVLALVKPPATDLTKMLEGDGPGGRKPLIAILDGVQDPGNAGAIVRVAEAFGATGMMFLKGTVGAFHPRTLRGSAGSSFRLPIVAGRDLDLDLEDLAGLRIYAAVPARAESTGPNNVTSSIELREADFTIPCAIAIGAEGRGVSEQLAAGSIAVHIPTRNVESLNAAVAAGILFYEASRQRAALKKVSA